jgi:hypothetical protein
VSGTAGRTSDRWGPFGGPQGKVYAVISAAQAACPGILDARKVVAAAYPNITDVMVEYPTMTLPDKADQFWSTDIAALNKTECGKSHVTRFE